MMTKIIYLEFKTPVRFGKDKGRPDLTETGLNCHSDTLFSALALEWKQLFGEAAMNELFQMSEKGQFRLADLLPYKDKTCFLPKPQKLFHSPPAEKIKAVKKMNYLPAEGFRGFCKDGLIPEEKLDFSEIIYQVRVNKRDQSDPLPYRVAALRFYENAGLYCLIQTDEAQKERILQVLESLGETGIGGKRSSGYGKFDLKRVVNLEKDTLTDSEKALKALIEKPEKMVMNLSLVLPESGDLKVLKDSQSAYQMIMRSGFTSDAGIKHQQVGMVNTGSCFPERIEGSMVNIWPSGSHPVYRYGYGFYIGVPYEQ